MIPARLEPLSRRVRVRFWGWSASLGPLLVLMGAALLSRGLSYVGRDGGPANHPAEAFFPIAVWGAVWTVAGVWCMVAAARPRSRRAAQPLGLGIGLQMIWGASFLASTVTGQMDRGWVTATGYLVYGLTLTWILWHLAWSARGVTRESV